MTRNKDEDLNIAAQVGDLQVPYGHLAIWALGQQGYLIKGGDKVLIIDPYLSNNIEDVAGVARQVPIVVQPEALDMIDWVFATHHHMDHCDPKSIGPILKASNDATCWTSYTGRDELVGQSVAAERIKVPAIDQLQQIDDSLAFTAIPSAHYTFEADENGNPAFLGFVVELNGVTFYHSGDTVVYDGMIERLEKHALDIAFLPINGRDWFREQDDLVGNLDYRESSELAARLNVRTLIPGHNDLFAGNRINPAYLTDYLNTNHPTQRYHFLQVGELYYYVK